MSRYFFDTDDGKTRYDDDTGSELADDQAARNEATLAITDMARDYLPGTGEPQENFTIWVRNEAGDIILQLALSFAVHRLSS